MSFIINLNVLFLIVIFLWKFNISDYYLLEYHGFDFKKIEF